MANTRKSLKKLRSFAYHRQNGCCYYCNQPMWIDSHLNFSSNYQITSKQAMLLRCTGEHLQAHHQGGLATKENIVAACWFCNSNRHCRKKAPSPEQYKQLVQKRLNAGCWHGFILN